MYGDGVLLCGEAGKIIDMWGTGVPPSILSGMMAAQTVEMAVQKNDFSKKTLKNYINFLDSTSLWRTMFESGKQEGYNEIIADIMEKSHRRYYDFSRREPYPLWKDIYFQIGKDFTPFFLHWIIAGWLHFSSFCSSLYNKIKKIFKNRYYEWKKDYERKQ